MVREIGSTATSYVKELIGLSTDIKPTASDIAPGSTFLELDTKNIYMFDGTTWYPL